MNACNWRKVSGLRSNSYGRTRRVLIGEIATLIHELPGSRPMASSTILRKLLEATRCWLFGAEMSRTARCKRSSLNLRCVPHRYFLETVNFSPVFLDIELGHSSNYIDRRSVKRLNRVWCCSIKARKSSPKLGANESHHS